MPSLNQLLARLSDMFESPGIPLANRNLFIDGAFDALQNGVPINSAQTLPTSVGYVAPAMWLASAGTGGAGNLQTFDLRTASDKNYSVLDQPQGNCLVWSQTTASTGTVAGFSAPILMQRLEGVKTGAGKSLTLSCKLWAGTGQQFTIPAIRLSQYFGGGTNSPSTQLNFDKNVNWVVTPNPQKFSVRIDLPSIQGKVIGNAGGDMIVVGIYLPPGVTFTAGIAEMQLELSNPNSSSDVNGKGGAATAFEYRGQQAELARVQRYYYSGGQVFEAGYATAATTIYSTYNFGQVMRATPAVSQGTPGTATNIGSLNIGGVSAYGYTPTFQVTATGAYTLANMVVTADARL